MDPDTRSRTNPHRRLLVGNAVAYRDRMIRPKVRYARADDDVTIAYSAFGEGPVTIVMISPLISQVEVAWEEPSFEHFMSRLAACAARRDVRPARNGSLRSHDRIR